MNGRSFLLTDAAAGLAGRTSGQSLSLRIKVYKSPTCGCCSARVDRMARAGFSVDVQDIDQDALYALKAQSGITPELASCHRRSYSAPGHHFPEFDPESNRLKAAIQNDTQLLRSQPASETFIAGGK